MVAKKRLDLVLQERFAQYSRRQIQSWIMQGKVRVDGIVVTKAGTGVSVNAELTLDLEEPKFVSRAGFKLEKALDHFDIAVRDLVVMDAGISTGGFTDCLLQRGARRVYGIDVGYGQVHEKISQDSRVVIHERTNLRDLRDLSEPVDMVTLDLSFISVLKVMEAVCAILKPEGMLIVLIKPQFEAERHEVGRKGIIKDAQLHQTIIDRVIKGIQSYGFTLQGVIDSPILGATGNKEFLAYFVRRP